MTIATRAAAAKPLMLALALSGCFQSAPTILQDDLAAKEADVFCYVEARDSADQLAVQDALSDGRLSEAECRSIIMPQVERANAEYRAKVRREAIAAIAASKGV